MAQPIAAATPSSQRPPVSAVVAVVATAAAAAFTARTLPVLGVDIPAGLYVAVLAGCAALGQLLPRPGIADGRAARLVASAAFAFAALYMARSSPAISGPDAYRELAGPLLLAVLPLSITWTTAARMRVTLVLTLAALLVASMQATTSDAALALVVWAAGAGWVLATLEHETLQETAALGASAPGPPVSAPVTARRGSLPDGDGRRRLRDVGGVLLLVALAVLVLANVQPQPLSGASSKRGDPAAQQDLTPYLGFSDRLDTSARGTPGDAVVMRVEAPAPAFWRGETFDHWDGRTWLRSSGFATVYHLLPGSGFVPPGVGDPPGGDTFVQRFHIVAPFAGMAFAAYRPEQVMLPVGGAAVGSDASIRLQTPLGAGAEYTVVSTRPLVTADSLRADDPRGVSIPPDIAGAYLQLPDVPARVRGLAQQVAGSAPTTYDAVLALEAWMGAHTTYTLDIPPLPEGADAVEQFLFVDRRGFCEQIASSLTVMLRSLGVPARLAVGFVPGDESLLGGEFTVRAKHAHAWVEVWFPESGWQAFDPTASVPLSGEHDGAVVARLRDLLHRLGPIAVVVAILLVLGGAVVLGLMLWRRWVSRRSRPWATVLFARMAQLGARRGRPRYRHETALEYAAALAVALTEPAMADVGRVLTAAAFSADPPDEPTRAWAEDVVRRARRRRRRR